MPWGGESDRGQGVLITGVYGAGKSSVAAEVAYLLERRRRRRSRRRGAWASRTWRWPTTARSMLSPGRSLAGSAGSDPARPARRAGARRRSGLRAVPGGEDDLGCQVVADAEFGRYLGRPQSLLVVEERKPFLPFGPRAAAHGLARWPPVRPRARPPVRARSPGRGGGAEVPNEPRR